MSATKQTRARRVGMTVVELWVRMRAHGIENANQLAEKLGGDRSMTWRWLNSKTTITVATAALIREKLPINSAV